MSYLSPIDAAELAANIYDVKAARKGGTYFFPNPIKHSFLFDLEEPQVLKGHAGFKLLPWFKSSTGFGAIGHGVNAHKGEAVIVVRGTAGRHDVFTDAQCGVRICSTGTLVHAGFNDTFHSMLPNLQRQLTLLAPTRIHCVGHSLGGAIATLIADWVASRTHHKSVLYTFGCPRVGMEAFAAKTTLNPKLERIFRVTHKGDIVTMAPLWPFVHTPNNGDEYRVDSASSLGPTAHFMSAEKGGVPGYIQSVRGHGWETLARRSGSILAFQSSEFLRYSDRHQTTFSRTGMERISAGLIAILKASGQYSAIAAQASVTTGLTFYDILAQTLDKIAKASTLQAEHVKGLLGHMLAFVGEAGRAIQEVTYQLIKMVFTKVLSTVGRLANQAMAGVV